MAAGTALFIPKKIKVGYQKRDDTYSKKLAYVIYYDNKGVLRKEKSWEGWRDKKIAADEFDNKPQDGFVLNKNIERYNWSHFGSGRSYIRMYDPRGVEFEITPENLIGILMNTTCSKRGLEGEFVYAWSGTELVLLPTNSEEYQQAIKYTDLQDGKIGAKELVAGRSYTTKKGDEVVYMGFFEWFKWERYGSGPRKGKKQHVFWSHDGKANPDHYRYGDEDDKGSFFPKDATFLAVCNNNDPVVNYATLVDKLQKDIHVSKGFKFIAKPAKISLESVTPKYHGYGPSLKKSSYFTFENGVVKEYEASIQSKYNPDTQKQEPNGYRLTVKQYFDTNKDATKEIVRENNNYSRYAYDDNRRAGLSVEEFEKKLKEMSDLYVQFDSGKKKILKSLDNLKD